jgi:hypothetical protein
MTSCFVMVPEAEENIIFWDLSILQQNMGTLLGNNILSGIYTIPNQTLGLINHV